MGGMIAGLGQVGLGALEGIEEGKRIREQGQAERAFFLHGAADAQARGGVSAGRAREAGSALVAEQAAGYADSGVDPSRGTAAQVQANTQMRAELDAQTIKNNAAAEAWGFDQARKRSWEEEKAKSSANERRMVGTILGGAGTFMSGAAKFGG